MAQEDFDSAADEAYQEFQKLQQGLTPEERAGINKLLVWWKKWFMTAGHRRLAGIFLGRRN